MKGSSSQSLTNLEQEVLQKQINYCWKKLVMFKHPVINGSLLRCRKYSHCLKYFMLTLDKHEKISLEQDSSLMGDFIKHLNKYVVDMLYITFSVNAEQWVVDTVYVLWKQNNEWLTWYMYCAYKINGKRSSFSSISVSYAVVYIHWSTRKDKYTRLPGIFQTCRRQNISYWLDMDIGMDNTSLN